MDKSTENKKTCGTCICFQKCGLPPILYGFNPSRCEAYDFAVTANKTACSEWEGEDDEDDDDGK